VKVVYNKDTTESLTYGFVKFERHEDALSAIHSLNGLEIYGKKMKVSFARPSDPEIKNSKIFITRLPRNYSNEDIHQLFIEVSSHSRTQLPLLAILMSRSDARPL
jgi:ELAV like protein 2/3/4